MKPTTYSAGLAVPASLRVRHIEALATSFGVPVEDVLLIAINLYGISSEQNRHRARIRVRLTRSLDVPWQVIVPLNARSSPFVLRESELMLGSAIVGYVERSDADEAVGAYFRNGGRAATLNPNARSRCTGCAFCPNTLEAAADPRLSEQRKLSELLTAMAQQHPHGDLRALREVTVSTGCFEREVAAVDHLRDLRSSLTTHEVSARIGFLSSVIRTDSAFEELSTFVAPFILRLTVECFTRRDLLLKATKARLEAEHMPDLLARASRNGLDTSYTYIVGLDSMPHMISGVGALARHVNAFPNFQVYQAHNAIMAGLRAKGGDQLAFYLEARQAIEKIMKPTGLRPVGWECYRPLWYFAYGDECLIDGAGTADASR